jgi:hypothetical protein
VAVVDPVAGRLSDQVRRDRLAAEVVPFEQLARTRAIPGSASAAGRRSGRPSEGKARGRRSPPGDELAQTLEGGRSAHWPVKSVIGRPQSTKPSESARDARQYGTGRAPVRRPAPIRLQDVFDARRRMPDTHGRCAPRSSSIPRSRPSHPRRRVTAGPAARERGVARTLRPGPPSGLPPDGCRNGRCGGRDGRTAACAAGARRPAPRRDRVGPDRAVRALRRPLGAVPRADDRQVGDVVRLPSTTRRTS